MTRVAVTITFRQGKYIVQGRKTREVYDTFDAAWEASVPYFAGRKR